MNDFARKLNVLMGDLYSTKGLNRLARKSGFVQRSDAKLDGYNFMIAMTLGGVCSVNRSLSSLVSSISNVVTRTALHDRMNQGAVDFMISVLEYTIGRLHKDRCALSVGALRRFNRILIWDSSGWGVHDRLQKVFEGKGGSGSKAGIFLQYAFDLKSSALEFFDIAPGTANDQHYRKQIQDVTATHDLLLFDRGYFNLDLFRTIGEKAGHYICRFKIGTTLYAKDRETHQKIDLCKLLRRCQDKRVLEFQAFLGREKLPSRIVCTKLPPAVVNRKIRKMKKEAKSRGKHVSKERLLMTRWCVFITNVPSEKLTAEQVTALYRLRWSIELIFKQLKSTYNIDKISHKNEHRLLCEMYGVLILTALTQHLHGVAQYLAWTKWKNEISIEKVFKLVRQSAFQLLQIMMGKKHGLAKFFVDFVNNIYRRCVKNRQPSRQSSIGKVLQLNRGIDVFFLKSKTLLAYAG